MSSAPRTLPRRTVLAASGTAVLAAAAACSSSTTPPTSSSSAALSTSAAASSTSAAASSTSAAPASSAASSAATSASAPSTAAADPTTAEAAPTGTPLASVADIESAGAVIADGPDGPVVLAASAGTVVGHSAICTHQGCTIAASGMCPCHGSRFDVVTGAVQNPPAQQPLAEFAVTVSGGQVYAG